VKRALPSLVVALAASLVAISHASADARKDQAAVAQLDTVYQAAGKLAPGADRTRQACLDATRLETAAAALPGRVPATAAIDDVTWSTSADELKRKVQDLVAVCQTPDLRLKKVVGKAQTGDEIVAFVDDLVRFVVNGSKPRDLPSAMKRFQTALKRTRGATKPLCAQQGKLAKLLLDLATPPARSDGSRWQGGHARMKASLEQLRSGCGAHGADAEIAAVYQELHDGYYALVLLIPPRT
jgi:hypothetical protein